MRRTSAGLLVVLALLGAGGGFLLDHLLTAGGRATFTPSLLLPVLLLLIAAASLGVAWPVRRSVRSGVRIDPFWLCGPRRSPVHRACSARFWPASAPGCSCSS